MTEKTNSRRSFLKLALGALAIAPALRIADAVAAGLKMIDDKTAKRLKYVADSAEAKKLKAGGDKNYSKYADGSNCGNCKFYKADAGNKGFGKCTMAANKHVSEKGWCKSYRAAK